MVKLPKNPMKYSYKFDKKTSCNFCRNGVFYYQQSKGALRTVSVSQSACFVSRKEEVCQSAPRRCVQSSVSRGVEPCWKGCVRAAGRRSVFLLLSMAACGQSSAPAGNRADLSRTAGQWPPAAVNKKQASESKRCLFFCFGNTAQFTADALRTAPAAAAHHLRCKNAR